MPTSLVTHEAHEFTHAVAGLAIDFVRTDRGFGPAVMTNAGARHVKVGVGGLDFSTVMDSETPEGSVAVQLLLTNPGGVTMCGVEVDQRRPSVFTPGVPVHGRLPAGVRAATLVAGASQLQHLAMDLGVGELDLGRTRVPMNPTPPVRQLVGALRLVATRPELIEAPGRDTLLLESLVLALAPAQPPARSAPRRRSSGDIVALALDHVLQTQTWLPTMSELCRATLASQSVVRAAFLDALGMPPSTYFQLRVMSELRRLLVTSTPDDSTVTGLASSLGLTQYGRVAGRYQVIYGETPRQTLQRRP
jgi:AraC-like DNA-binding protein